MGGNTFAHAVSTTSPSLNIPRMTLERYTRLKAIYEDKLRRFLPGKRVSILKEAPEKTSYGDLDFFFESAGEQIDWKSLAAQLGAAGLIIHSSGKVQSCSLAVPIDGSASRKLSLFNHNLRPAGLLEPTATGEYAQIDIQAVPQDLFEWHSFYSSYGDMGGLLGHMVHSLGFTVCDRGLMLRLAALEAAKQMDAVNIPDKLGRLFLSKDPQEVLRFLGLSYDVYKQGFTTVEELYGWLSHCTLLSKDSIKIKKDDANGRQKERKRPLYTNFFHVWLPAYFDKRGENLNGTENLPVCSAHGDQRQEVLPRALAFFHRESEYEQMNTALILKIQSQTVDALLKPIVAQHSGLVEKKVNEIIRGFRRWVGFRDGSPYILSTPHDDEQSELYNFLGDEDKMILQDETRVDAWVKGHWEVVKRLERERSKVSGLPG